MLGNISSGQATLSSTGGNLTINQTSEKLIANWNSFDVGVQSTVTFNQPAVSSMALNRISSGSPTEIFGRVQANGQLILVNPAGMLFGAAARVNAASVIASSFNITDASFNAGTLQFDRGNSTATIDNQGIIQADAGNAFIFASSVKNSGTIHAKSGNLTIANANQLTVDQVAGTITLNKGSGIAGLIQSSGFLGADRLATTEKGKVFLLGDQHQNGSMVNLAGEIASAKLAVDAKALNITDSLIINSDTTLNVGNSIHVGDVLTVSGDNRSIHVNYGTTGADNLYFSGTGKIRLPGSGVAFSANGIDYQVIKSLSDLRSIDNGYRNSLSGHYVLGVDIDASSTLRSGFSPIGASYDAFTGVFDGLGNAIVNLTIKLPNSDNVGLFSSVSNGVVKNTSLANANIQGRHFVGGLVGHAGSANSGASVISGNTVSGLVKGIDNVGGLVGQIFVGGTTIVSNNSSNAQVSARSDVGGLLGAGQINAGSFLFDGNTMWGDVRSQGGMSGGLIASIYNDGGSLVKLSNNTMYGDTISKGIYTENNIGGAFGGLYNVFSGSSFQLVKNYNYGNVNTTPAAQYVGGLIGDAGGYNGASLYIEDSGNTGKVSGGSGVGGLVGSTFQAYIQSSYNYGTVHAASSAGGLVGVNNNSGISSSYNSGLVFSGGNSGAYGIGGLVGHNLGAQAILDGNVNDARVRADSANTVDAIGGLVGYNENGVIKNNQSHGNVSGGDSVGGLVGRNVGGIVSGSHATGNISGLIGVGGLIGHNETGAIKYSSAAGRVRGEDNVGGLVGTILNTNIAHSFATGSVSGHTSLGGLVGFLENYNSTIYIDSNYATGDVWSDITGSPMLVAAGGLIGNVLNSRLRDGVGDFAVTKVTKVTNNYATGSLRVTGLGVGGLIGFEGNGGNGLFYLTNNYAAGKILASDPWFTGGVIGVVFDNPNNLSSKSFILNNYWNKDLSGKNAGLGTNSLLNRSTSNLTGLTTAQSKQLSSYAGWDISSATTGSSSIWYINNGVATPVLRSLIAP